MRQVGRIKHGGGKNKEERLPKAVRIYLSKSGELEQKVAENIEELTAVVTRQLQAAGLGEARYFHQMLIKHIDLVKCRMLEEETIPHEEKSFPCSSLTLNGLTKANCTLRWNWDIKYLSPPINTNWCLITR